MKTYKTCNICHSSKTLDEFYNSKATKDGKTYKCKDCTKSYSSKYKKDNAEATKRYSKAYQKKHYQENREDRLLWQKEYRERNLEFRREYDREHSKAYYEENKSRFIEKGARRRASSIQATPPWVDEIHKERLRSIYKTCRNVSRSSGKPHHVDHIVPLKGENICGLHVWWNLRIVPAEINLSKGNRLEVF